MNCKFKIGDRVRHHFSPNFIVKVVRVNKNGKKIKVNGVNSDMSDWKAGKHNCWVRCKEFEFVDFIPEQF